MQAVTDVELVAGITQLRDPLVLHPSFRRLYHLNQLAMLAWMYPKANHNRAVHSIDTFERGVRAARRLGDAGGFDARTAQLFFPLHDIGHYAFSHSVETLQLARGRPDHHERGAKLILGPVQDDYGRRLGDIISDHGADPSAVASLFFEKSPEAQLCKHKVLGADKLSYLALDAQRLELHQPSVEPEAILDHVIVGTDDDGERTLGISLYDQRGRSLVPTASAVERFYFSSFADAYFQPQSLFLERCLQRNTQEALESGKISDDFLETCTDWELLKATDSKEIIDNRQARTLCSFRVHGFDFYRSEAPYTDVVSNSWARRFMNISDNPLALTALERRIEDETGIDVRVTGIPESSRFEPIDVDFFENGSYKGRLLEHLPGRKEALKGILDHAYAIRVTPMNGAGGPQAGQVAASFLRHSEALMRADGS